MTAMVLSLITLASMLPAVAQAFRERAGRDGVFWGALGLAMLGPLVWVLAHSLGRWQTGLAATLWTTIAATMSLYLLVAWLFRHAWRLSGLIAAYMLVLGAGAVVWQQAPPHPLSVEGAASAWLNVHIATAVVTYALVTIAAVAAAAAFLQDRALKRKRPTSLTRQLPSIADCEQLQVTLLTWGEAVLAVGLLTGMALEYQEAGRLLPLTHKSVLTMAAFVVIGGLLIAQRWSGVRGRQAARLVLLGYLLLTLGYPGVKFVSDVLLG